MAKTDEQLAQEQLADRGVDYKYGGDSVFGAFIPERRRILRPEQEQFVGYDSSGNAIIQNIPAEYGPSEYDPSFSPVVRGARSAGSFLRDIFLGDANEQSAAFGKAASALRGMGEGIADYAGGQARSALAGGVSFNQDTGQVDRFDPLVVMGGGGAPSGSLASGFGRSRSALDTSNAARLRRADEQGFGDVLYHAAAPKQPIDEFKPKYSDNLTFLTTDKDFANNWLGKGGSRSDLYENDELLKMFRADRQKIFDKYSSKYGADTNNWPKQALEEYRLEDSELVSTYRSTNQSIYPVRTNVQNTFDPSKDTDVLDALMRFKGVDPDSNTLNSGMTNRQAYQSGNYILYENPEVVGFLKERGFDSMRLAEYYDKPMSTIAIFDPKNIRSVNAQFDPEQRESANILYSGGGRTGTGVAAGSALRESFRIGDEGFDARFDDRALEQDRIQNTELQYDVRPFERPEVSIYDLEGKPFRLTMSDRTAAGRDLTGVEGVEYDIPINLQGGQDFMFANPLGREGQVWAQDKGATSKYLNSFLGLDGQPMGDEFLMLPFRMSPAGGDFATMTGEVMVTHARNNVPARAKRQADEKIRQFYPAWKGIDNPESLQQISEMKGDPRKALLNVMDKDLRNEGGLGIGQARLAVSDRSQYNALDTGLQNVGIATPNIVSVNRRGRPILERFEDSGHRTYEQGLAGRPMGTLIEQDISAYELLPDYLVGRGFRNFEDLMASDPSVLATEAFTLRRGTRGGTITEDMLRDIERRRSQ